MQNSNVYYKNRLDDIEYFYELQFKLETLLSDNILKTKYSQWVGNKHIVMLFTNNQCITCVQKILLDFSLVNQKTGFTNFSILGCFENENDYHEVINQLDNEFRYEFLVDNYNLLRKLKHPIVFMVDEKVNIEYIYSPDLFPEVRNWYFYSLVTQYINMKTN